MNEIFKKVEGFTEYEISNLGRLKSLKYGKSKILSCWKGGDGYLKHSFTKNGLRKKVFIHHLVLNAFGEKRPAEFIGTQVMVARHKNSVRTDNRIENLSWGTMADNSRDMVEAGNSTFGEKAKHSKLTEANAVEILASKESYVNLAKRYGVSRSVIWCVKKGKTWAHVRNNASIEINLKPRNKLDETAVRVIRKLNVSAKSLAYFYGVSNVLINMVRRRQWWKHVA